MNTILYNGFRFILLIAIQVLLLNNIALYNLAVPYPYILFIILLPMDIPVFWLYLFSFLLGFTVDIFSNTPGIHASACLIMALTRVSTLGIINPRHSSEFETNPSIRNLGFNRFFIFASILIIVHHFSLFLIEIFRFSEIFYILIKIFSSILFTLVLVLLSQYIFSGQRLKTR